jgi:hypothetical protein
VDERGERGRGLGLVVAEDEAEQPEPRERGDAERREHGPRQERTGHTNRIGPAH